ncbi:MAG: DMT family transporter [Hyphomicrobiaceae bacterium]
MSDNVKGILAMLASAMGFVTNDATVKFVTQELPNGQIIFLRGLVATALMGLITSILGGWRSPVVLLKPAMCGRLVAAALATLFIVAGLRHMPLATTNAILQVSPLLVTAGAAIFLGSHVGWRRWTASLVGFAGVLLIVKPGMDGFVPEVLLVIAALIASSTRDLITRFVDQSVPSIFVTFATSAAITVVGLALMPFETWVMPTPRALWLILLSSACLFCAYHFGVVAMRTGDIPVVAPFRYTAVILALILGFAIWGHIPDAVSLAGIALIVAAGFYLLVRQRTDVRIAVDRPAAAPRRQEEVTS